MAAHVPPPPLCSSLSTAPSTSLSLFPNLSTRFPSNSMVLNLNRSSVVQICSPTPKLRAIVARAAVDDGLTPASETPASEGGSNGESKEGETESISVQDLPLESNLEMIAEKKLQFRIAKKLRLRRKRLLLKRKLRKKGRWPPSKMRKNKNV